MFDKEQKSRDYILRHIFGESQAKENQYKNSKFSLVIKYQKNKLRSDFLFSLI